MNIHVSQLSSAELHNLSIWSVIGFSFFVLSNMPGIRGAESGDLTLNNGPPQLHVDKTGQKRTVGIYLSSQMRHPSLHSHWASARRKMCTFLQPQLARNILTRRLYY